MKQITHSHPLEHDVPDYLNDRLSAAARSEFEKALETDAELRDIVDFERKIKKTVRATAQDPVRAPRFASLERRLEQTSARSWAPGGTWLLPTAAAVALAVLVGINLDFSGGDDPYITLTDQPVSYEQPMIRIVTFGPLPEQQLDAILAEHQLRVVERYPSVNSIDLEPIDRSALPAIIEALANDDRVRFAQKVTESP
ncbi:MAG: hypothetical protein AAFM91_05615 [Pseudomonadota bacterium]